MNLSHPKMVPHFSMFITQSSTRMETSMIRSKVGGRECHWKWEDKEGEGGNDNALAQKLQGNSSSYLDTN